MPGPWQVVVTPSPVNHVTIVGVAVAVALTVPTVAVTEKECQMLASIQSHVGRFTTEMPAGLVYPVGGGNRSEFSASESDREGADWRIGWGGCIRNPFGFGTDCAGRLICTGHRIRFLEWARPVRFLLHRSGQAWYRCIAKGWHRFLHLRRPPRHLGYHPPIRSQKPQL